VIKINGVALARQPMRYTPSYNDLASEQSGRNALGQMLKDRIATKVKLELVWGGRRWSQASSILQAISDIYFTVTYPDVKTGSDRTMTCYAGDPQLTVSHIDPVSGKPFYRDMKVSLIER
jgi:hypothetical protein